MPSFAVSIAILSLLQAVVVALPRPHRFEWLDAFRSPWWALVPALSIVVVIGVVALEGESATAFAWLALVAVPPLAALALGVLVRGAGPAWAPAVLPLFALAWAGQGSLPGEAAATALTALACVALGWLLVSIVPAAWLKLGIYAMAAVDTWLVASDLLQGPNAVLSAAAPAELPRLQVIHLGSAQMGFGDFFAAATLGCLLARTPRLQLRAALLVAILALAFDLLFFAVDELPATVPVAVSLALLELRGRDRPTRSARARWRRSGGRRPSGGPSRSFRGHRARCGR